MTEPQLGTRPRFGGQERSSWLLGGAETMSKALGEGRKVASSGLAGVGLQLGRRWLVLLYPKALTLPAKLY